jgi:hypothetical protein
MWKCKSLAENSPPALIATQAAVAVPVLVAMGGGRDSGGRDGAM